MVLEDLFKLKEEEIQKYLDDKSRFLKPGTLVWYNSSIYKIVYRKESTLVVQNDNGAINVTSIGNCSPLTYTLYKTLKQKHLNSKYKGGIKYTILVLSSVSKELYGEDRVHIIYHNRDEVRLVIHYPTIEITNSLGTKHIIKDLFIEYTFRKYDDGVVLTNLRAVKATYSPGEIRQNYLHSHISNNGIFQRSSSFCFGSTQFKQFMDKLRNSYNIIDKGDIYQLFLGMDKYLEWESLEGTPYNRIDSIRDFNVTNLNKTAPKGLIDECYKHIVNTVDSFEYSVNTVNDSFTVSVTSSFEQELKSFLEFREPNMLVRVSNGVPVNVSTSSTNEYDRYIGASVLSFKDRAIRAQVDKSRGDISKLDEFYPLRVLPELVIAVKVKLEQGIKNYLINKQAQ